MSDENLEESVIIYKNWWDLFREKLGMPSFKEDNHGNQAFGTIISCADGASVNHTYDDWAEDMRSIAIASSQVSQHEGPRKTNLGAMQSPLKIRCDAAGETAELCDVYQTLDRIIVEKRGNIDLIRPAKRSEIPHRPQCQQSNHR